MTLRHLAVHVDRDKRCPVRLDYAVQLANKFGASLEGVFVHVPPSLPPAIEGGITAQVVEAQQAYNERAEQEARAAFDAAVGACKSETVWTSMEGYRAEVMTRRAMGADLTIVAQPDPDEAVAVTDYDLPADVVMRSGRPLLAIPYAGKFEVSVGTVVIAWNGSRESARAVADALPLLAGAKAHVLAINPPDDMAPVKGVRAFLGHHGIEAEHDEIHTRDLSPGDMILSRMADLGAGLVVMGAYGRSRFREMVLGGVTHHLLRHMTAPVLLSH